MGELIDREVAAEILEARSNMAVLMNAQPVFLYAANMIRKLPAVDAVDVVRCKDCKYMKRVGNVGGFCRNEDIMRMRINDDFCSKGVKIDLE